MTTPVHVRRATVEDVALAAPLFAAYREFYRLPYDERAAAAFLHDRLQAEESVVLLAETADGTVGFLQLYPGFESLALAPAWVLNDLYVAPAARGSGVAAALMERAEEVARAAGAAFLALETAHDNHVAQRLYERQGWQVEDAYRTYVKPLR
ncbi:MAG: Acetyltransferase, GNAT family [uncultured Nocardioidaceae bacterium]|uniref:Acetyltransferase, GNAT family n=1 Tax=uncultured Nocardioidaceae bacterium TaxID=253824 RepID=A0A6J4M7R6_9ACTN|nr:MAG: Acetyltransferase, GNAT family [uncultured Nocardioidaceae bacterium]